MFSFTIDFTGLAAKDKASYLQRIKQVCYRSYHDLVKIELSVFVWQQSKVWLEVVG